jgi:glycosyltransferase involved in cell wall biosynthesis
MKTLLVKGPALSRSGYGEQTRFALRALRNHEDKYNLLLLNIPWGHTGWINQDDEEVTWLLHLMAKAENHIRHKAQIDISLQSTIPNEWESIAPINIGYTAGIETTRVSPAWIEKASMMDKIIVVSNHSKNVFEQTSYKVTNNETNKEFIMKNTTPIEVVNYPVRTLEQQAFDLDLDYDFNFVTVAQMGPRKNMDNTIKWFIEEFHDDEVGLILKTNMANCSTMDRFVCTERLQQLLKQFPDRKCKIYLLHGDLTLEEMNYLYAHPKVKSYITLTHGEGFGIPIFEAAYHGVPVIAPNWSGQCDFLNAPVQSRKQKRTKIRPLFCKVDYNIGEIPQEIVWEGVLEEGASWCYPTEKSAKQCMRDMYKNYTKYIGMSRKLQKHILKNFTEQDQNEKMATAILGDTNEIELEDWLSEFSGELEVHE